MESDGFENFMPLHSRYPVIQETKTRQGAQCGTEAPSEAWRVLLGLIWLIRFNKAITAQFEIFRLRRVPDATR